MYDNGLGELDDEEEGEDDLSDDDMAEHIKNMQKI